MNALNIKARKFCDILRPYVVTILEEHEDFKEFYFEIGSRHLSVQDFVDTEKLKGKTRALKLKQVRSVLVRIFIAMSSVRSGVYFFVICYKDMQGNTTEKTFMYNSDLEQLAEN